MNQEKTFENFNHRQEIAAFPYVSDKQFIRTVVVENDPYFCFVDLAMILEFKDHKKAFYSIYDPEEFNFVDEIRPLYELEWLAVSDIPILFDVEIDDDELGITNSLKFIDEDHMWHLLFESKHYMAKRIAKYMSNFIIPSLKMLGVQEVKKRLINIKNNI